MLATEIQRDIISFSAVISACEKVTEWQQAIGFIDVMPEFHIEPNLIAFNAAISSCEKKLRCVQKKLSSMMFVLKVVVSLIFFQLYPANLGEDEPILTSIIQKKGGSTTAQFLLVKISTVY